MINIPGHEPPTMHMSIKWTQWCISAYNQQQQQQLLWQQQLCLNHLRHTPQLGQQQQLLNKCIYEVWLTFSTTKSMILQPLKLSSIAYNRHIQMHQQPCYYCQPNLINQVIKHRNSLQIQGYSPRRVHLLAMASSKDGLLASGELGASWERVVQGALGLFDIFLTKTSFLSSLIIFLIWKLS